MVKPFQDAYCICGLDASIAYKPTNPPDAVGVPEGEAERRAWATVNKESGGGKNSGSGRGHSESHAASRKGGRLGGRASAHRSAAARSRSAKKAARTRKARGH